MLKDYDHNGVDLAKACGLQQQDVLAAIKWAFTDSGPTKSQMAESFELRSKIDESFKRMVSMWAVEYILSLRKEVSKAIALQVFVTPGKTILDKLHTIIDIGQSFVQGSTDEQAIMKSNIISFVADQLIKQAPPEGYDDECDLFNLLGIKAPGPEEEEHDKETIN